MRLHSGLTINGREYSSGDEIPGRYVYPFFLVHMLAFGLSGFLLAYSGAPVAILYMHGGIAILVYLVFYLAIFGRDEVAWMFINAGLGIGGILSQLDWILSLFGKRVGDFPPTVHVIPILYFVLYTFLIRHALLDLFHADDDATRRRVQYGYVGGSLLLYLALHFLGV